VVVEYVARPAGEVFGPTGVAVTRDGDPERTRRTPAELPPAQIGMYSSVRILELGARSASDEPVLGGILANDPLLGGDLAGCGEDPAQFRPRRRNRRSVRDRPSRADSEALHIATHNDCIGSRVAIA
jgi:hypothetical protein